MLKILGLPGCGRLEPHYAPKQVDAGQASLRGETDTARYPRISVVVPSLNQGQFIGQTLESIISQSYPDLELIVVDGGSTDDSVQVIESYQKHITWWVSEPDKGQAHAINKGMGQATGDILAWLNSDDCLMPNALYRIGAIFINNPDVDVVYGQRVLINEEGQDIGKWILPTHRNFILTYADYIPQETMYWRRKLWDKVGGYVEESFKFAMDWELIRRFIETDAKFKLIPAFLGQFRVHSSQKTSAAIESDGFREMEIIRLRCREAFSKNPSRQKLYYRVQLASLGLFLLEARLAELAWSMSLRRID
jgi:glycosyltransferase involved in cell wall biosynthesis